MVEANHRRHASRRVSLSSSGVTAKCAAPGARDSRAAEASKGNGANLPQLGLAPHVVAALDREGITDLESWRRLGRKRRQIFGITPRTVETLDRAARNEGRTCRVSP